MTTAFVRDRTVLDATLRAIARTVLVPARQTVPLAERYHFGCFVLHGRRFRLNIPGKMTKKSTGNDALPIICSARTQDRQIRN